MKRVLILLAVMAMFVACSGSKTPVDQICDLTEELAKAMTQENAQENPEVFTKAFQLIGLFEEHKDYVLTDADKDRFSKLLDTVEEYAKKSGDLGGDIEEVEESSAKAREALKDAKTIGDLQSLINM